MGKQFGATVENNTLTLPESIGHGYLKSVDLPNGLQALIGNFTLHQDLLIERSKTNMEYYVFICDRVTNHKKLYVDVDQDRMEGKGHRMEVMYLLSFLSDLNQFASAGTHLESVRVIISREWLARYLRIDQLENVLQRYLSLKAKSIHIREMDFETKTLMNEILNPPDVSPVETAFLQNRIMMMVENFFSWMYDQLSVMEMQIHMTRDEIEQMMKVEESLTGDLSNETTIKQLSVQAAMSPSKLKKQFKDVYGFPIYEYFQKKRMEKARAMLLEGNRTIKAVGRELGFSNLSNFSVAFRKEHQLLPSELLKIREES
jgi:AraC-like DNA-binding protein